MPVYEYRCPACANRFERLASMASRDEAARCPSCDEGAERVVSTFAAFALDGDQTAALGGGCCGGNGGGCACRG